MRRFVEFLGRLGFAAQALVWLKQFLAPLYEWSTVTPDGAVVKPPQLVKLVLVFVMESLTSGLFRIPCRSPEAFGGELFRTDSKGADDRVVLAGWETKGSLDTSSARWFCLELSQADAPWLFKEGKGSSWSSTSSELLASLIGLQLFGAGVSGQRSSGEVIVSAGTDNKANEALTLKRSSTKLPLMFILMQLAWGLGKQSLRLQLHWRPREENVEADALTNLDFSKFHPDNRIQVSWDLVGKSLQLKLLATQSEFESALALGRNSKGVASLVKASKRLKLARKTPW